MNDSDSRISLGPVEHSERPAYKSNFKTNNEDLCGGNSLQASFGRLSL